MTTIKDYTQTKFKVGYSVVTNENLTIAKFVKKETAEDFIKNAYSGYYNDCKIKFTV